MADATKSRRRFLSRLQKVEAVMADGAATEGEKAAAAAAASKIREEWRREKAEAASLDANPGVMYLLGRALGRARQQTGDAVSTATPGIMYRLGRVFGKVKSKW